MTPMNKAFALVDAIRSALAAGTVHTNRVGERLENVGAILRCLRDEGCVHLSGPSGPTGTSNYDALELGREATSGGRYDSLIKKK